MRVGLVTSAYAPERGGLESYVENLTNALVRIGCSVEVLTQCPYGKDVAWSGGETYAGSTVRHFPDMTHTQHFRIAPSLWTYLKHAGSEYDVLHAHNFHAFPCVAAALASETPLVVSPHFHAVGHTFAARMLHIPYDRIAHKIFSRAHAAICDSRAEAALLRSKYPEFDSRIRVVGTGVDSAELATIDPFELDPPIVLAGGRLVPYKRIPRIVKSFAELRSDATLVITGTGPDESRIRALIDELGLSDRVLMVGQIDRAELQRWQRTASVVVSLSTQEAFGLGLAEAAVAGAWMIASDIPAHREVTSMAGDISGLVDVDATTVEVGARIEEAIHRQRRMVAQLGFATWDEVAALVQDTYLDALDKQR